MAIMNTNYEVSQSENRIMVTVRCKECGEKLRVRGSVNNGKVDIGVKMCFCGNENLEMTLAK